MQGSVPTSADLPGSATIGHGWLAADTGHLWVWTQAGWVDVGNITGPAGPPGPNVVSANAGNVAVIGTDGRIFVPNALDEIYIGPDDPGSSAQIWIDTGSDTEVLDYDHAQLLGLDTDDHPQYLNTARANAAYLRRDGTGSMVGHLVLGLAPVLGSHAVRLSDLSALAGRRVIAGSGLSGGGTLETDRTLRVAGGTGIVVGTEVSVDPTVVATFSEGDLRWVRRNMLTVSTANPSGAGSGVGHVWITY